MIQGRAGRSLVILQGRAGRSLVILQGRAGRSLVILQGPCRITRDDSPPSLAGLPGLGGALRPGGQLRPRDNTARPLNPRPWFRAVRVLACVCRDQPKYRATCWASLLLDRGCIGHCLQNARRRRGMLDGVGVGPVGVGVGPPALFKSLTK